MNEFGTESNPEQQPDPILSPAPSSDADSTRTAHVQSTDDAQLSARVSDSDHGAIHTFQVTHKVANPENPASNSLFHSAELTVDEAIAWIRERLLHS